MIQEYNLISIKEIAQRVKRHPLLENLSFEKIIQYVVDFYSVTGIPHQFVDKVEIVDIYGYKGLLPCDVVQIMQVKDMRSKVCMRSMTDTFYQRQNRDRNEPAFKTQGNIIYVTFEQGKIDIAYKAIQTDEDGLPMIPDNPVFLRALELYIKKEEFDMLFDLSQIPAVVLNNTHQQYALAIGQLKSDMTMPSVSEMESISRMWNTLVQRTTEFDDGFRHLGDREYIKIKPR